MAIIHSIQNAIILMMDTKVVLNLPTPSLFVSARKVVKVKQPWIADFRLTTSLGILP
jgi:hypothetical protein